MTEANSTHPARIRCTVERAAGNDDNIVYLPYMQLLSTEHSAQSVRRSNNSTLYEIIYRDIDSSNSSHYLEFEYDIYLHQDSTDYTIAQCGTIIHWNIMGDNIIYCWAETYTLIRYNPADMAEDNTTETTPPTPAATITHTITSSIYTAATSTVTVSISTPVPTACPTPVCYTPTIPPPAVPPPPPPEPFIIPTISIGMAIAILVAVIELIVIFLLVRNRRANDVAHPGEIHANEAREDEKKDDE